MDYQRQRVYDWEHKHIRSKDLSHVPFNRIKSMVDYVWEREGLHYPPQVGIFPKQVRRWAGDAERLELRFHEERSTPTCVILHEIAHAMNADIEHSGDRHGPNFVGIYMRLLEKYCHMNILILMATAKECGVQFNILATPTFVDG